MAPRGSRAYLRWSWRSLVAAYGEEQALYLLEDQVGMGEFSMRIDADVEENGYIGTGSSPWVEADEVHDEAPALPFDLLDVLDSRWLLPEHRPSAALMKSLRTPATS